VSPDSAAAPMMNVAYKKYQRVYPATREVFES